MKILFGWKSLSTLSKWYPKHVHGNFYLKAYLHSLIPPFTETFTQPVKRRMYLNVFLAKNVKRDFA